MLNRLQLSSLRASGRYRIAPGVVLLVLIMIVVTDARAQADDTYIPLDSWVYPVVEDLSQRGVLPPVWLSLRPWTRSNVADLLRQSQQATSEADTLRLAMLRREFAVQSEDTSITVDAVRQRITAIAGEPIQDGFHFAQTTVNDNGRAPAEGANSFTGIRLRAHLWHVAGVIDGETQRVSNGFALSPEARAGIAVADFTPQAAAGPQQGFLRGRLMEAYVVLPFHGNEISIGRQSLWWGPARSGATLFSTNSEPIAMLRYDRVAPVVLRGPFRWLGEARGQILIGRLAGTQFAHADHQTFGVPGVALNDQPWIHAEKVSFRPTRTFEFSVSRSVLFAGAGAPFTARSLWKSFFSSGTGNEQSDPGDRRAAFDANWSLPRTNGCVRVYADTFTEDEPFPLAYVKESAWITGFSWNCLSHAQHWSLRAEGLVSPHRDILPGFYYFNVHYLSGYTQQRQLIGSWIGREGKGAQAWLTWRPSEKTTVEFSQRSIRVDPEFLQGGSLYDAQVTAHHLAAGGRWEWQGQVQAERWRFSILQLDARYNVTMTGQITWHPGRL